MKIGIIGRSEWTYTSMQALENAGHQVVFVVTSKEAKEYKVNKEDFKAFADTRGIPFLHDAKITKNKIVDIAGEDRPDICISVNYNGIISQDVIECFRLGILNAHGGDLPRYRGNACIAWAIINAERKVGLCVHKMVGDELDSGDIIARDYRDIGINTRIGEIFDWMDITIPKLFLSALNKLESNASFVLEVQSKNPKDALRCYPRLPEDCEISWHNNSLDIIRLINASSEPFQGAFTYYDNYKVTIWRAYLDEHKEPHVGIPGQVTVINHNDGSVNVLTRNGHVKLTSISIDGKKIAPSTIVKSLRSRFRSHAFSLE